MTSRVVIRGGNVRGPQGVPGEQGEPGEQGPGGDVTGAEIVAARNAAQSAAADAGANANAADDSAIQAAASAAAATAVGTTNDTIIASRVNDPASATRTALTTTFAPIAAAFDQRRMVYVRPGSIPAGLGWDAAIAPVVPSITEALNGDVVGSAGITATALFDAYSTARSAPANTLYVAPTGSDANPGTSGSPLRSLHAAVAAANALGTPTKVNVAAGSYDRANGFDGTSPTVDIAFVATGDVLAGPVLTAADLATFAANGTYTKTQYVNSATLAPSSAVARVIDLTRTDRYGQPIELTRVSSPTICDNTPDTYHQAANVLYVHRLDGAALTATNTRIIHAADALVISSEVNVYVGSAVGARWQMFGGKISDSNGDGGTIRAVITTPSNVAAKAIVVENASCNAAGRQTDSTNAISTIRWYGVVALFNVQTHGAAKDDINVHNAAPAATKALLLTVNCTGDDAGRPGQTSCNGITLHENCIGIDIAGKYRQGRGGTVHNINQSKHYLLGTLVEGDLGDLIQGGVIPPNAVRVNDTATIWAERVTVKMPPGALAYAAVAAGSTINRRDAAPVAQPNSGPGVFATY